MFCWHSVKVFMLLISIYLIWSLTVVQSYTGSVIIWNNSLINKYINTIIFGAQTVFFLLSVISPWQPTTFLKEQRNDHCANISFQNEISVWNEWEQSAKKSDKTETSKSLCLQCKPSLIINSATRSTGIHWHSHTKELWEFLTLISTLISRALFPDVWTSSALLAHYFYIHVQTLHTCSNFTYMLNMSVLVM